MAEGADSDDKTEEPTQRRLEQAREKGDIIYSTEVGAAFTLIALACIISFGSGPIAHQMTRAFTGFLASPAQFATDAPTVTRIAMAAGMKMLTMFGVAAIALAVAGLAARFVQDRPTFNTGKLAPNIEKLSPVKGFERVFGKQAFATFMKALAKFALVGGALTAALWPKDASLSLMSLLDPAAMLPYVRDRAVDMMVWLAAAALFLAALDYVFTRQSYMKRLRMSRRELKEEMRQSEGDPLVKAKLRQIRHERSKKRMLANVPNASVVVTNPTHYAVALRYEEGETPAPICLAKGVDDVAARIREVANEHNIPIVEDPPLARALFAAADIDEPIPREHYEAAAKVIGFVLRLARRRGRRPPPRREGAL